MPKKPVEKLRVPLNCLIAPATKEMLAQIKKKTGESIGQIVDRAVDALERERAIDAAEQPRDVAAQARAQYIEMSRHFIDPSESLECPQPNADSPQVIVAAGPLLKPSERKKK